jgi:uncharacterized protein (UPF0276 family)
MTTHAHFDRPSEAPFLGVGVGLRPVHYAAILDDANTGHCGIDFVEAISENYMVDGGRPLRALSDVRARLPIVLHGVSMNLGSCDPLDVAYLDRLAALSARFEPAWVSDHLCFTGVAGRTLHDLVPLPRNEACIRHVTERVARVQDRLRRRIAIENVSSYLAFEADDLPEWEFLVAIADRADCGILLDVNNVFVNAHNHDFDAKTYLDAIPPARVFQIHLAGHSVAGELLIDTHDHPVRDEVWALYEHAIRRLGPVSTLLERDDHIPPFAELVAEASEARAILERVLAEEIGNDARGHAAAAVSTDQRA